jgi:predicted acyltransferase
MRAKLKTVLRRPTPSHIRDLVVDRFRGALIVLMVIGDYIGGINWIPAELKHAPDIGFTIADTVAPAFVFVIGLNFGPSFMRRIGQGRLATYRHFLVRYLFIFAIGATITAGAAVANQPMTWGVLESLGTAGIITIFLIELPTWARFTVGLLVLGGYQYAVDTALLENVLSSGHGGPFGAISWTALLLLSTAVADVWRKGLNPYLICLAAITATATISAFIIPVSKNRVSFSYVLVALAISAITFLVIKVLSKDRAPNPGVLCWWGQNSLTLYFLHLLMLAPFGLSGDPWWYRDNPAWLMLIQITVILAFMTLAARGLTALKNRKRAAASHEKPAPPKTPIV